MCAGAMFYSTVELKAATKSEKCLHTWVNKTAGIISNNGNVQFGSEKNKAVAYMRQCIPKLNPKKRSELLKNAMQGISAAIAVKGWLQHDHKQRADVKASMVFLTGDKWPAEVTKFRVSKYGFDDYNSSDLIVKTSARQYFGVSLKKKPSANSADPTLINKAFTTLINGDGPNNAFKKARQDLDERRTGYFAARVRDAIELGILNLEDENGKDLSKDMSDEELFRGKTRKTLFAHRDKAQQFKYPYVDAKGNHVEGYTTEPTSCKLPDMKSFINDDLKRKDNSLWAEFRNIVLKNGDTFADQLINLVLKVNLQEDLSASNNLEKYRFGFGLITGIGTAAKIPKTDEYKLTLGAGTYIDQHTILCGLAKIARNKAKYVIDIDWAATDKADAAKIFFTISKKSVPILSLELRYKGKFTPQPQFFANITPEFKQIMVSKCLIPD